MTSRRAPLRAVASSLRAVRTSLRGTASRMSRRRMTAIVAALAVLVAVAVCVPLPSAVALRDWARSVGPWFPMVFFAVHVVLTVLPFPRTAFTLAAGLLFGPALGIVLAVAASTISALIALALVRAAGWQLTRLVDHPGVAALDARLRRRGWPTVLSTRLIPAMPFSVVNYAAGASAVRVVPYALATVVGLIPGTAAIVILGDAVTGTTSPLLLAVSVATAAVGCLGLVFEVRAHRGGQRAAGRGEDDAGVSARADPTTAVRPVVPARGPE